MGNHISEDFVITLHENVTFPIGNIVLLDRIKKDFGYFDPYFDS
jgi:hypothetical protein